MTYISDDIAQNCQTLRKVPRNISESRTPFYGHFPIRRASLHGDASDGRYSQNLSFDPPMASSVCGVILLHDGIIPQNEGFQNELSKGTLSGPFSASAVIRFLCGPKTSKSCEASERLATWPGFARPPEMSTSAVRLGCSREPPPPPRPDRALERRQLVEHVDLAGGSH